MKMTSEARQARRAEMKKSNDRIALEVKNRREAQRSFDAFWATLHNEAREGWMEAKHAEAWQEESVRVHTSYMWMVDRKERTLESAKECIAKFAIDVVAQPAYAMKWSVDAFNAAAIISVFTGLLELASAKGMDRAVECAREQVMRANWMPDSSSPCSNLMSAYEAKAFATFATSGW